MKINENFNLRKIADTWAALPVGKATLDFTGILTLNESAVMLWNLLLKGAEREELVSAITSEYDVTYEEALVDVDEFIEKLKDAKCIDM